MASLYMVASPLGNLKDITFRAVEILKEADVIACEDTRHSSRLLQAYDIRKPLVSCHGYNEKKSAEHIVKLLREGKTIAYLSDAGTPGVSDPGNILVAAVAEAGFDVVPLPGPSALTALLSVLALPGKRVVFEGFLSPKAGRRRRQLISLFEAEAIVVLYESPFRILALLKDIQELDPQADVVLGREISKIHEEILRGKIGDLAADLESRPSIKGEFVLAIKPSHLKEETEKA